MTTEDTVRCRLAELVTPRRGGGHVSTLGAGGYNLEGGRTFLASVVSDGFAVPSWPAAFGGRGSSSEEAAMIARVVEEFAVPDLYPFRVGLQMVGPTLLELGSPAQQERWLPTIAAGREIWCQMFSEPEAGSDLANVGTVARIQGEGWSLDGQKVWTSRAAYSDWGICLARTNVSAPKHKGLTMFAVRMSDPGVQVRPLTQMNGDSHFSEVFLSEVFVSDAYRIAAVGAGWSVAVCLLAHERAAGSRNAVQAIGYEMVPMWLADLAARGRLVDPVVRDRAMALYVREQALTFTEARFRGQPGGPGPRGSVLKLHGARNFKLRAELTLDPLGPAAMLDGSPEVVDFLTAPSMSIRGGTDQIQSNVIAERILGLPRELPVDRDVPWNEQRRGR